MSPRKRFGQKQERLGEKVVCGVGVLQRREGVRERLGETRDWRARDAETEGETGERDRVSGREIVRGRDTIRDKETKRVWMSR